MLVARRMLIVSKFSQKRDPLEISELPHKRHGRPLLLLLREELENEVNSTCKSESLANTEPLWALLGE